MRVRIHPDGCACDVPWAHRPAAAALAAARRVEQVARAARRRIGKEAGNAARLRNARRGR